MWMVSSVIHLASLDAGRATTLRRRRQGNLLGKAALNTDQTCDARLATNDLAAGVPQMAC